MTADVVDRLVKQPSSEQPDEAGPLSLKELR
jgi:hypothetical protein